MVGQPQRPNYRGGPDQGRPELCGGFRPPADLGHSDLMPGGIAGPPPGMPPMPGAGGMMMGPDHGMFQNPQNLP